MITFQNLHPHNASIIVCGRNELTITTTPVFDPFFVSVPYFSAFAVDADNNEYFVVWNMTKPHNNNIADKVPEKNDCDWSKPSIVSMLNNKVYTAREAEQLWGLGMNTVTKWIERDKFKKYEHRKSGGTWLITKSGMERLAGNKKSE